MCGDTLNIYESYFQQALDILKADNDNHHVEFYNGDTFTRAYNNNFELLNFGDYEYEYIANKKRNIRNVTVNCLCNIITSLLKNNECFKIYIKKIEHAELSPIIFTAVDLSNKCAYFFKDIEKDLLWKSKDEPPVILKYMKSINCETCEYIYLVEDERKLLINDLDNVHNYYWFLEKFFGKASLNEFIKAYKEYIFQTDELVGYVLSKTLTPNSLANYRYRIRKLISKRDYYKYLTPFKVNDKRYELDKESYDFLYDSFLTQKRIFLMFTDNDFSDSFITAEWMYITMKKAHSIDLTVIAMGYFKCIEQLLHDLICLRVNEGRQYNTHRKISLDLIDSNLGKIEFSLGTMANFYKESNKKLSDSFLIKNLNRKTCNYIIEKIFSYKDLRNGHLHIHNIKSWDLIELIRNETISMFFLLLSSYDFSEIDLLKLKMPNLELFDDFYYLGEYIDYHNFSKFIVEKNGIFNVYISARSLNKIIYPSTFVKHKSIYMLSIAEHKYHVIENKDINDVKIYWAGNVISKEDIIDVDFSKSKLIFDKGKYVGPKNF